MSEQNQDTNTEGQQFTGEAAGVDRDATMPVFEGVQPSASTALARIESEASMSPFASASNYETAKKMATALSQSGMVPVQYQGKIANCMIALEIAARTGAGIFAVMQNLHIIQGRPSWSSAFLIGSVNSSGRFTPLRYEVVGEPMKAGWKCRAYARDRTTGETLYGTWITTEMVNAEGWSRKSGSKWLTMPEQMGFYRAAAFWVRVHSPETSLGMHTNDELDDSNLPAVSEGTQDLNAALRAARGVQATAKIAMETTADAAGATAKTPTGKPGCPICFRTDGSHDPNASCGKEEEERIRREDAEIAKREAAKGRR